MGNCESAVSPKIRNRCTNYGDKLGSNPDVQGGMILQNFCAEFDPYDKRTRKQFCGMVGQGEWEYEGTNNGANRCLDSSCNPGDEFLVWNCCGGCCSGNGEGVVCKRKKQGGYTGSKIPCCLQDYGGCNILNGTLGPVATKPPPNPGVYTADQMNLCFSDVITDNTYPTEINRDREFKLCYPQKGGTNDDPQDNCLNTCAPCLRDMTSDQNMSVLSGGKLTTCGNLNESTCRDEIYNYCTGADLPVGDDSWIYRWMKPDGNVLLNGCLKAIPRNLFLVSGHVVGCDIETVCEDDCKKENCTITTTYPDGTKNTQKCSGVRECDQLYEEQSRSCFEYGSKNGGVQTVGTTTQQTCQLTTSYFNRITTDDSCTPINYPQSSDGYNYVKKLLDGTLERYAREGYILGSTPGLPGYNPFQDLIYSSVCCRFPNLCSDSLSSACAGFSAQQLSYNVSAANICGCYLPDNEYAKYVDEFQVNKECTPLCNRPGSVPLSNPDGSAVRCRQDICIIDDIAFNLTTTNITGEINITQMCANCSDNSSYDDRASASCSCNINANEINTSGDEIGGIDINNTCTGTSCNITNPYTNEIETVSCSEIPEELERFRIENEEQVRSLKQTRTNRNILILGIMLVGILSIILLFFLVYRDKSVKSNSYSPTPLENDRVIFNYPVEPIPASVQRSYYAD